MAAMLLMDVIGPLKRAMKNKLTLVALASLALSLMFPLLFSNPAVTTIAVFTLIFAGAATSWNIFSGYTGYISLGHAAFYGIGAYILMILCQVWNIPGGALPLLLLPVVGLATGICAIPLGWVALKTRRYIFMVLTIAIFVISSQLPNLLNNITTSMGELSLPIPTWSGDIYNLPFYYTALILLLLALGVSWYIRNSKYGLSLLAIRDDEDRALGLGVKTTVYKLAAFVISAIFVGMAGALNAYFLGFVSPTSAFDRSFNIAVPLMAFLGGLGTLTGPIIGALVVVPLQQYLTLQSGDQGWDLILYGVLFLVIILAMPSGIVPALTRRWSMWTNPHGMMNIAETPPVAFNDMPVAVMKPANPPVLQEPIAHAVSNVRQVERISLPIPHRRSEQSIPKEQTQKVRVARLTSYPQVEPAAKPGTMTVPPTGRSCPRCREMLSVWGGTQFCTRCGLVLSHPKRGQPSLPSFAPPRAGTGRKLRDF